MTRLALLLLLREWRHHPVRHAVAALAVGLGVALAWGVHVINQSALSEFTSAVREANGDPDLSLRGQREGFDDALFEQVAQLPQVRVASPVLELDTYARSEQAPERKALRVLGVDAFRVAPLAPALMPQPAPGSSRYAVLEPAHVYANAAARQQWQLVDGGFIELQSGPRWQRLQVGGSIAAAGPPLLVMDIAGAQQLFSQQGRVTRIDLRLAPGSEAAARQALQALLPPAVTLQAPAQGEQRVSNLSRAYRVNLTVLALVALFVGAFLVYSVMALSVAQRSGSLALLGVLGWPAAERRAAVLLECGLLGAFGAALGIALGTGLAAAALAWLAGDLGGGYFPGVRPTLHAPWPAAFGFWALGVASSVLGGWVPARQAERIAPAQALKGLGHAGSHTTPLWPALLLLAAGAGLALLPPVAGLPLAAYASVAALLLGGVMTIPALVAAVLAWPRPPASALPLLAWRRAQQQRHTATAAVAGVVASLALCVALTVMVASFRTSVAQWLDSVLPADLYARTASSSAATDQAWFDDSTVARVAALPGVARVQAARARALLWAPEQPPVVLITRALQGDVSQALPMVAPPLPRPPGVVAVYASEAMAALHGATPGSTLQLPLGGQTHEVRVLGVWRDYARQFGTLAIDLADYRRLSGDTRLSELALWLAPGASMAEVQAGLRAAMSEPSMIEFAASGELRAISLRIFDRSFAVTQLLQVLAIAIGLVGVAASLSAQVLARRKEFGLLAHLGLTQRQVLALVAAEVAAWLAAGVLLGLLLGLAVSVVLVHVVNPQSFHWTMELVLPALPLLLLCAAVWAAGVATAAFSARQAASRSAVLSVKEDW